MAWAEAVTAISTALIAVMLGVAAVAMVSLFRELHGLSADLRKLSGVIDQDARPALQSVRNLIDDAGRAVSTVRGEVEGMVDTSKGVRKRVERVADSVETRLLDLDALLDVVQDEIEDTALDIAAALRTTRRGGKLLRRVKRTLIGRRR